jgi:hypothetical protein
MKRNRIVINLDQAAGGSRRKRSGSLSKILLAIALVLLLAGGAIAGGGYVWWKRYQSSPGYTLAVLADAAQKNDTATIDGILDTDKVCDDFVGQVRRHAGGSVADAISSVWPGQTDAALKTISPKLKETVHDEMVKELQRVTEPAKGKPFFLLAVVIGRFANIKEENGAAQVKVDINDEHLELTMQPATQPGGARWRVTAVQDEKLATQIAEGITSNLPSAGAGIKDAIEKQLGKIKK